jgi:hypothetical protein
VVVASAALAAVAEMPEAGARAAVGKLKHGNRTANLRVQ